MTGGIGFSNRQQGRKFNAGRLAASAEMLKDEICRLRQHMERTYLEEDSLRSERLIEVSRKLDKKINEYMRYKQRCWEG
jgi:Spo0E like sporulation regulatory protein.